MALVKGFHVFLRLPRAERIYPRVIPGIFQVRNASSGNNSNDIGNMYELRTYNVKPDQFKSFVKTCTEWIHVRTLHSKLTAFWISELGGLNDAIFLWEYKSVGQRSNVRHSISLDNEWQNTVLPQILPMIHRQENSLIACLPGTSIGDLDDHGVYELQHFNHDGVDIDSVASCLQQAGQKPGAALIGNFYTLIGPRSEGYQLWRYNTMYDVQPGPLKVGQSAGIRFGHSRLMSPLKWTEMQDM